jgi:hypothetical protein
MRPLPAESAPYFAKYINLVPDGDIVETLERQRAATLPLLQGISGQQSLHRYAADKWSIREVLGHISDTERVFSYRALVFARGDQSPLPSFEQDDYIRGAAFDRVPWADLMAEFEQVRRATIALFKGLTPEAWQRQGVASGNPMTARAAAWIIAGHELHHLAALRERYSIR